MRLGGLGFRGCALGREGRIVQRLDGSHVTTHACHHEEVEHCETDGDP
jgi:hypothetical protein